MEVDVDGEDGEGWRWSSESDRAGETSSYEEFVRREFESEGTEVRREGFLVDVEDGCFSIGFTCEIRAKGWEAGLEDVGGYGRGGRRTEDGQAVITFFVSLKSPRR